MNTESTKTGAWIVAACILGVAAFMYLPQRIELESQAKVNEPMFPTYQPSSVWEIQIQSPPTADFKRRQTATAVVEQLTAKRFANRGWELLEFESYPAENTQRLGLLAAILNDLKILEVISENASDNELAEYGLLAPDAADGGADSQKGTRLKLQTSSAEIIGDLIVGKSIPANNQAVATAYVRPASEKVIYRVGLDKSALTTALVDWINPSMLGIPGPADLPSFGPTFRTVESIEVSTARQGRPNGDPYRAEFTYGDPVKLERLSTFDGSEWVSVPLQRLPASVEFGQTWRRGLDIVPAFLLPVYTQVKSPALQTVFRTAALSASVELGELADLGFSWEEFKDGPRMVGETGLLSVGTRGGVRFHFSIGRAKSDTTVPVIIYADIAPSDAQPAPEIGQLPEEAAEWSEEKRAMEMEALQRAHAQEMEEWNLFNKQRNSDLASLNERLAPWIYFLPVQYVEQALPNFKLSETATPATPPVSDPSTKSEAGTANSEE